MALLKKSSLPYVFFEACLRQADDVKSSSRAAPANKKPGTEA
jgi:hypothetical protein